MPAAGSVSLPDLELYLAGSEVAFLREGLAVFKIQLAKKLDTVPLTRNYIARTEIYVRGRDSAAANLQLVARSRTFAQQRLMRA
jgi:hypothetical protein